MTTIYNIYKPLLKLAISLIIIQLCQASIGLVDTLIAGQYHYRDLAAVGLGSSIWTPVFIFCTGSLYVLVPKFSTVTSMGQTDQARVLLAQGKHIAIILSFLSFILIQILALISPLLIQDSNVAIITKNYLHWVAFAIPGFGYMVLFRFMCEGSSILKPIIITVVALLVINAILTVCFVNGVLFIPEMGGAGAGLATAVSAYLALMLMVNLVKRSLPSLIKAPKAKVSLKTSMELLKEGLPIGITLVLQILALTTLAFFASSLGVYVIGAHQIVINIAMMVVMIPLALSSATTIRIAHYQAIKDVQNKQATGLAAALITIVYSCLVVIILLNFGELMVGLFSHDREVLALAYPLIIYMAIFQFFDAIQMVASGVLRGLQEFIKPFLMILFTYWIVIIPFSYSIGVRGWLFGAPNINAVWLILASGMSIAACVLVGYAYRYLQEKNNECL